MTTTEVVEGLRRERDRLLAAVDALGPHATTEWVTEPGGWNAQDVLAHLIHYAGQIGFVLGAPLEPPPYVLAESRRLSGQEWNDRAVGHWRNRSLAAVRAEFEATAEAIIDHAAKKSDAEMTADVGLAWAPSQPLWQFVGNDTFLREWPAHAAQLEAAAARRD